MAVEGHTTEHPAASAVADHEDVEALLLGLALLSTGGGGTIARGREYLDALLDEGHAIGWQPLDALAGDLMSCSVFGMGSIALYDPMDEDEQQDAGYRGWRVPRPGLRAVEHLGAALGRPVQAVVPFELGPFNTIVAVDAAARLGLPLVDGDYIGRALPELSQALPAVQGKPVVPAAVCDQWGNALLLQDSPSPLIVEAVGKAISTVTKRPDTRATCIHAAFPARLAEVAPAVVRGSLSRALTIGRALRQARRDGADPVTAASGAAGARVLLRGTVRDVELHDGGGYLDGTVLVDTDAGDLGRVWFRNENHVAWLGERVVATSPDLIALVADDDGEPLSNAQVAAGRPVAVLGMPAEPQYREPAALRATEPRHYGLDVDYVPLDAGGR